jgi:hypothetical protein
MNCAIFPCKPPEFDQFIFCTFEKNVSAAKGLRRATEGILRSDRALTQVKRKIDR